MDRDRKLPLRDAIDAFRESQRNVYRSQPGRLRRDTSSANEVIRDHVGRWPYELVQNAEDARATEVEIHFGTDTIYFADNGDGLPVGAVESLSGTHFSVKPPSSIGRKGLGFKAVYCVSPSPTVFCGPEGMVFDRDQAIQWMEEKGLGTKHVPYQWLPFWIGRKEAEEADSPLHGLRAFRTVVRLLVPTNGQLASAWSLLQSFASETLLTFENLRRVKIRGQNGAEIAIGLEVGKKPGTVLISDSRKESTVSWAVARAELDAPENLLEGFDAGDDRERARHIGLLVAAPIGSDGSTNALQEYPNLHVYYPTEEHSPVRALLHGDFLIKSDRTAIVPIGETQYNEWVARELSGLLIRFAMHSYTPKTPSTYLRLLCPKPNLQVRSNSQQLWVHIVNAAVASLLLPGRDGKLNLKCSDGLRLGFNECRSAARTIFSTSEYAEFLIHPSVDEDIDATQALTAFKVKSLGATDVLDCIRELVTKQKVNQTWVWSCWEWLSAWAGDNKERLEIASRLPVIPCRDEFVSGVQALEMTITWEYVDSSEKFPEWLPLRFIENWFRDRLLALPKDSAIRKLVEHMQIVEPGPGTLLGALGRAANSFWEQKDGDPARFLKLILEKKWYETEERPEELGFCPVPSRKEGSEKLIWTAARDAYFGGEWGARRLAKLYAGIDKVRWVVAAQRIGNKEVLRKAFEWLDVKAYPWIVYGDDPAGNAKERSRVIGYLPNCTAVGKTESPSSLEHIHLAATPSNKYDALVFLLANNWDRYYESYAALSIRYKYYGWSLMKVPSLWWEKLLNESKPPLVGYASASVPLKKAWLFSDRLRRLTSLLPILDLRDLSKKERELVLPWLREKVRLREKPEQLDEDELKSIIMNRIPELVPESACVDRRKREQVSRWYAELIDVCRDLKPKRPDLSGAPLLCCRGEEWTYVDDEDVWLDDDHDASLAFKGEIWTISVRRELRKVAQEVFGLQSLAENKHVTPHWSELPLERTKDQTIERMTALLREVKPFIFVWMSHTRSDRFATGLRDRIRDLRLRYVGSLEVSVELNGVDQTKNIRRAYAVDNHVLVLDIDRSSESSLAKALADALHVAEANLFEILFRCVDDSARRRKLCEDQNVPSDELERYLSEWREGEPDLEIVEEGEAVGEGNGEDATGEPRAEDGGKRPALSPVEAPAADPISANSADCTGPGPSTEQPVHADGREVEVKEQPTRVLRLKNPKEVGTAEAVYEAKGAGNSSTDSSASGGEQEQLTDAQRKHIERVSREFAEMQLQRLGFSVEQMPLDNPGFDIRATKKGAPVLLVEVKGHIGRAAVIELTAREYGEYSRCLKSKSETWELWNIEQLSQERPGEVLVTRFEEIPDHALMGVRGFRVDLRSCLKVVEQD